MTTTDQLAGPATIARINTLRDEVVRIGGDGPGLHATVAVARRAYRNGNLRETTAAGVIDRLERIRADVVREGARTI